MAKGERTSEARFCTKCGRRAQPADRFCSGCGTALAADSAERVPSTTMVPGLVVLVFFLAAGFALWMDLLSTASRQAPPLPPQAEAPALPQGHPPIELPPQAKEALAALERDAEGAPADIVKWRRLAGMQYEASRFDPEYGAKAARSYEKVLDLAPKDPAALAGLGNIYYDRQQYDKAASYYEQYLAVGESDPAVETDLATAYLYQGETEKAIAGYKKVVSKHPDFVQAHFNLGVAYRVAGKKDEAVASLRRARDLSADEKVKERIDSLVEEILADGKAPSLSGQSAGGTGS